MQNNNNNDNGDIISDDNNKNNNNNNYTNYNNNYYHSDQPFLSVTNPCVRLHNICKCNNDDHFAFSEHLVFHRLLGVLLKSFCRRIEVDKYGITKDGVVLKK